MKKIIVCLLLLSMILCTFASCKNKEEETDTTIPIEVDTGDGLPDVDMDGYKFSILQYNTEWFTWSESTLVPQSEESMGNKLYEEMYKRNVSLEDRFNFTFDIHPQKMIGVNEIETLAMAGDQTYDVIMYYDKWVINSVQYFKDWNACEYLRLDEDHWNPNLTQNFKIKNKQFALSGDFSLGMLSRTTAMLFNKTMYKDYVGQGEVKPIYDSVKNGDWTLEEFYNTAKIIASSEDETWNEEDTYGVCASKKSYYFSMMIGSNVKFTDLKKDGNLTFTLPTDQSSKDKLEKILEYNKGDYARVHFDNSDNIDLSRPLNFFEDGHTLFAIKSLVDIPKVRANMEEEFGIVPIPKYDTEQTEYINSCDGGDVACLLSTVPDSELENIGIIMEAWAYSSNQSLIPLYKEELIKSRYASDVDSYEILDIVFDGAYAAGGLGGINMDTVMRELVTSYFIPQDTGLASLLQMMAPAVKSSIRQLLNNID